MKNIVILLFLTTVISSCNSQSDNQVQIIDIETLKTEAIGKDVQLVDVRTPEEYNAGHIDDAININVLDTETFNKKVLSLDKEKPVYIYCKVGGRSNKASQILKELGFKTIYDYSGGYTEWSAKNK
ncbi:rhodanese-like domain-containing protein [Maribacter sp. MMG018]|uniref:rhodanese-like domain-containing protein n=1 Tax=Maribacter sp. MMG018 TaxID=2822688 RepID=UPI001B38AB59|nr:rhodanese-like domain-containing protein [Maribacter sp. MMG018]MBQ4914691.1 rhodanese-like domain-containing protein [Maribacter sp. MMG018]